MVKVYLFKTIHHIDHICYLKNGLLSLRIGLRVWVWRGIGVVLSGGSLVRGCRAGLWPGSAVKHRSAGTRFTGGGTGTGLRAGAVSKRDQGVVLKGLGSTAG